MPPLRMDAAASAAPKLKRASGMGLNLNAVFSFCLLVVFFIVPAMVLMRTPASGADLCSHVATEVKPWSGDLREAEFAWNKLKFPDFGAPPVSLRIAVFSRKWPTSSTPGGMERHAKTLYTALAERGHRVHVFTSPPFNKSAVTSVNPVIHWYPGEPDRWLPSKAWEIFEEEHQLGLFDVIHSESVALPFWLAEGLKNLAVSWHGIALESVQSSIYQDLARNSGEPRSADFSKSLEDSIPKVLNEIRFFAKYAHHIAITDSCGEMLRDVYQIPSERVHVILNGVNDEDFVSDSESGKKLRSDIGIPKNASLVLGIAGRLVRDKGHPLLFEAFSKFRIKHPNVYLIVAGSGPWENRYKELGSQVLVLGSMNPTQLRAFYNAIDIFVNPTLRPQGLDLTLMEAMMTGKPVMASRFPSIKGSLIVDDEFGFMFSPNADSLYKTLEAALAEGPRRLAERGQACRRYAGSMFTARKMAVAYERLFLCISNSKYCSFP